MKTINQTAERNAQKMTGYTFTPANTPGFYWVKKSRSVKYLTSSLSNYCDCPQGEAEGICKHNVWLKDQLECEAARIAEYEAQQAARGELESLRF